ncbi:hypothetical protein ACHAXS_009194 [Conticribra weissflogii]
MLPVNSDFNDEKCLPCAIVGTHFIRFYGNYRLTPNFILLALEIYITMKNCQTVALLCVAFVACASAFAPVAPTTRAPSVKAVKPLAMVPKDETSVKDQNAAAIAAFATAMAPFAAQAADVDEGVVIGYGAGLVACVVSLAVGFAIGYGTLVKP